jgi:hypothetical protein
MTTNNEILRDQLDKIRDVQSILTAISKFDPGGIECRLADMAEKQLDAIYNALDAIEVKL